MNKQNQFHKENGSTVFYSTVRVKRMVSKASSAIAIHSHFIFEMHWPRAVFQQLIYAIKKPQTNQADFHYYQMNAMYTKRTKHENKDLFLFRIPLVCSAFPVCSVVQ